MDEAIIPKFTSEESAKEKARILSLLDKLHFVDAMKAYAQAVVQNNYVPKELVISARKTVNAEMGNLIELGESLPRMIDSDAREVIFTMLGGEDAFKAMIRALPKTLVEMPTDQEGTEVKKVSGITLMHWLPEYLKKMAN